MTLTINYQLTGSFSGSPFQYAFGYDSAANNYYVAHVTANSSGVIVDPATSEGQASALTALQAIETSTAAGATAAGQASALTVLQAIETSSAAGATAAGQALALTELQTIAGIVAKQPPLTYVDQSNTTSSTASTFTVLVQPNSARGYLRVSNPNVSGVLYVYDKVAGTPSVNNSIAIQPGQHFTWDKNVPGNVIQIAGGAASLAYEACEGA